MRLPKPSCVPGGYLEKDERLLWLTSLYTDLTVYSLSLRDGTVIEECQHVVNTRPHADEIFHCTSAETLTD
jgi:hypothetical protein